MIVNILFSLGNIIIGNIIKLTLNANLLERKVANSLSIISKSSM